MLSAEKKNLSYTYSISGVKDSFGDLIGCLNSNFLGTEFNLMNKNETYAAITYDINILGIKGPRKMKVYLPGLNSSNQMMSIKSNNVNMPNLEKRHTHKKS